MTGSRPGFDAGPAPDPLATGYPAWLVLCEPDDADGIWAHEGLSRRGLAPLELVTSAQLVDARRWEHRLGAEGVSLEVELADGRTIRGDRVHGVLNRLAGVFPGQLARGAPEDREYASQELYAFFLSWLAGLPGRVLNRPSPQGLSGVWLDPTEWLVLAARAGLSAPAYRSGARRRRPPLGTRRTVLVVGRRALGPSAEPELVESCGRLARLVRAAILGVDFSVEAGRWSFAGATPLPRLSRGGERLLDLLAEALRDGGTPA